MLKGCDVKILHANLGRPCTKTSKDSLSRFITFGQTEMFCGITKIVLLPAVASVVSWSLQGVTAYWLGSGAVGSRA